MLVHMSRAGKLRGRLELVSEGRRRAPGPARVGEQGARDRDHVGTAAGDDLFRLPGIVDQADGAHGNADRLLHRFGEMHLVAGTGRDPLVRGIAAARAADVGRACVLQGTGDLAPGTPGSFEITKTPPFAPALLFFSLVEVGVPFKGGVLQAYPPIALFPISMGPSGLSMPWASWNSPLPSGVDMFFQFAIKDPGAAKGVSLTNLLRGTTQP